MTLTPGQIAAALLFVAAIGVVAIIFGYWP